MYGKLINLLQKTSFIHALPWIVLSLGLIITTFLAVVTREREQEFFKQEFSVHVDEITAGLERRLTGNAQILRGLVGLFNSSETVEREEFSRYAAALQLEKNYPGILGAGYIKTIAPAEQNAHIAAMRAQGFAQYILWPGGERNLYSAVSYFEPWNEENKRTLGFDVLADPVRAAAALRARDTSRITVTNRIARLLAVSGPDTESGVFFFAPLYRRGVALDSLDSRQTALEGWVYLPLKMKTVMDNYLLSEYAELSGKIVLHLYAGTAQNEEALLYALPAGEHRPASPYQAVRVLNVADTQWLVTIDPLYGPNVDGLLSSREGIIAVLGFCLSVPLAIVSRLLAVGHIGIRRALLKATLANEALEKQEAAARLANAVLSASPGGIVVTDAERKILSVNQAFTRITGYEAAEVFGKTPTLLSSGRQPALFYQNMWQTISDTGYWEGELVNRHKDGHLMPVLLSISRVLNEKGEVLNYVGMLMDITERRKAEERIRHLAHHDYLTDLPNRMLLMERATQALALARRYNRRMAIIFIDLDRFKPINDLYGHDAGDAVLRTVAQRLSSMMRQSDTVCRQGGDEFLILLPEFADFAGLAKIAEELWAVIQEPCEFENHLLTVSASIGVATYPENGDTVDAIIQSADSAMYRAKADGNKHVCFAKGSQ